MWSTVEAKHRGPLQRRWCSFTAYVPSSYIKLWGVLHVQKVHVNASRLTAGFQQISRTWSKRMCLQAHTCSDPSQIVSHAQVPGPHYVCVDDALDVNRMPVGPIQALCIGLHSTRTSLNEEQMLALITPHACVAAPQQPASNGICCDLQDTLLGALLVPRGTKYHPALELQHSCIV